MYLNHVESDSFCKKGFLTNSFSQSFLRTHHLNEISQSVSHYPVKKGDIIIEEFKSATHYYILVHGNADVFHTEDGETPVQIATLSRGDTIGEKGLIIGKHTESVIMKEDGLLLRMDKKEFFQHLYTPLLSEVTVDIAHHLASEGWQFIDIRYDFELEIFGGIDDAIHIPLHALKKRIPEVDNNGKYIVFCKSGNRSKAATMLLAHNGIKACSLSGGFTGWQKALFA